MGKNFNQEIADLENGLVTLKNMINDPKTNKRKTDNAIIELEIQKVRIEFFKIGYNLRKKEVENQAKLIKGDDGQTEIEKLVQDELILK